MRRNVKMEDSDEDSDEKDNTPKVAKRKSQSTKSFSSKPPFGQLTVLKELYVDWKMLLPRPYYAGKDWEPLFPQSLEALTVRDHYETGIARTVQPISMEYPLIMTARLKMTRMLSQRARLS